MEGRIQNQKSSNILCEPAFYGGAYTSDSRSRIEKIKRKSLTRKTICLLSCGRVYSRDRYSRSDKHDFMLFQFRRSEDSKIAKNKCVTMAVYLLENH